MFYRKLLPATLLLVGTACGRAGDSALSPDETFTAEFAPASGPPTYVAPARGSSEVPPRDTHARGNAVFQVFGESASIQYRLLVFGITNVVQAHIHIAPAGSNGPVVVFLYPVHAPGGGPLNGVIATGTITAANLIGPLAGQPLSALTSAMRAGHTDDGVAPSNTGPGDFPGGEVRGQIKLGQPG
jgi:hypothetical protein